MLPGKKYTPEDIIRLLARRAWVIVGLFLIGAAGAVAVSSRLPDKYRSETLIMVVPQRVPDSFVKSTVTSTAEDRLTTITQQILSRSRLERIILDLNLYEDLRKTEVMEDVVQQMRKDIPPLNIEKGDTTFRVAYVSRDPKVAQQVTERLASALIEENGRDRRITAEDTSQFLETQLEDARGRLIESEKKLEEYKLRHRGQLPTQATINLQAIQNAQLQLQANADAMNREREHRLLVERQIVDLESPDPMVAASANPSAGAAVVPIGPVAGESVAQSLDNARAQLKVLLTRFKPDHPDVRFVERNIKELEAKLAAEVNSPASSGAAAARPQSPSEVLKQRRVRELRAQVEQIDRDLQEKQAQEKLLRSQVAEYQAKLDAMPERESELVELTRDYTTLQLQYTSLLSKREESKLAADLERRNIGEQFRVLDPARVPERPFSPNRLVIYIAGAGGGLLLGLFLTAFFEYRDTSLKTADDVARLFDLPVLALVPSMASDAEKRTRRRRVVYAGIAVFFVLASGTAVAAFLFLRA